MEGHQVIYVNSHTVSGFATNKLLNCLDFITSYVQVLELFSLSPRYQHAFAYVTICILGKHFLLKFFVMLVIKSSVHATEQQDKIGSILYHEIQPD